MGGRLLGEYSTTGSANLETIVLDGGLPVGVVPSGGTSAKPATTLRVYAGHLSEPRRIIDAANRLRWSWDGDPFGVGTANSNPAGLGVFNNDMRFPGQVFDSETSTHYNLTRSYYPAHGRYLQPDTIGLAGGINTYAYALSNSANLVDPLGLDCDYGVPSAAGNNTGEPQFLGMWDVLGYLDTGWSLAETGIETGLGTADLVLRFGLYVSDPTPENTANLINAGIARATH